ncbi:DUF2877 domain-containing protein [Bacillus sp. Bva_UNVM-123]|uniref:DUF2877 domain-containing protein n=1 Tax=Bacillus sp. Bva_UNVM-123 TaxID=2829798 RepID=UPI00391F68DB
MNKSLEVEYGVKSNYLPHIFFENSLGRIHSIFQTSFNIVIQEQLVHFGALGTPLSAFGVNIPSNSLERIMKLIEIGNSVLYQDGNVIIHTTYYEVIIKLDKILEVDLRLNRLPIDLLKNNEIFRLINEMDFIKNSGVIHSVVESDLIKEIINARSDNKQVIKRGIAHFLGRGIGLTPSGDDFISGLIMVESSFSNHSFWQDELRDYLKSHSTTDVSYSYLNCLLNGYVSEGFRNLLINLSVTVEKTKAIRIVNNILAYGHTSGIDTLFGIQVALNQFANNGKLK